jgi:hypothetical protein
LLRETEDFARRRHSLDPAAHLAHPVRT